ncbi:citrate/2-methylcitrate synthase [Humibacter sp. RRB41]|uniref:citrate/2-methylcitrate synthase n=1 Tax=Humibacter sp. RRB41 TaxID=2919946 RepID=UPI001FAAEA44|nr:citrate/2-methylcitrate synthase [Humibacter sp. RRB41]
MTTISPLLEAPPGLKGVVVAETSIGDVLGAEGRYHYRGHDAIELARAGRFEDAWHLLVLGTLPDADAGGIFRARVASLQQLPPSVREFVASVTGPRDAAHSILDPLRGLQATLPVLAASRGARPIYDLNEDERVEEALAVAAAAPGILAAFHRARVGLEPVVGSPRPDLGVVANYLFQVTGREPDARAVGALSAYLIATLDHGFNASTFTARVIASTGADMESCIVGGLGALSGPLHGGAPSRALDALDAVAAGSSNAVGTDLPKAVGTDLPKAVGIDSSGAVDTDSLEGDGDRVERFIRGELSAGRRLMGFGHAVYRTVDPRSRLLKQVALDFGGPRVGLAVEYEQSAERLLNEYKPGRDLHTNVEFYAAVVLEQCGIPREMFTPTFAMARVVGWSAHVLEQARDPKIIRPSSRYVGS